MDKEEKKKKEKKNIFQQLEEQRKKLEKLKIKKENEIKKIIMNSFDFLTDQETLIRFSELTKSQSFLENIKNIILKEMGKEEKKQKEEKEKKLKEERNTENTENNEGSEG